MDPNEVGGGDCPDQTPTPLKGMFAWHSYFCMTRSSPPPPPPPPCTLDIFVPRFRESVGILNLIRPSVPLSFPYEKKLYGTYMSKLYVKYRGHIIVKYMSHICILNVNEVEDI